VSTDRLDRHRPVRPARVRARDRSDVTLVDRWRKRLGWAAVLLGVALFLTGSLGASFGVVVLPFDQHHVVGQAGGLLLALTALRTATR
jgi:hypothetical protein